MMSNTPATALISTKRKTEMRCIQTSTPDGGGAEAGCSGGSRTADGVPEEELDSGGLVEVETGVGSVIQRRPCRHSAHTRANREISGIKPIGLFYDFRALMRSATSR